MKTEDKELLLKYLCARLPHGIKVQVDYSSCNDDPSNIEDDEIVIIDKFGEEIFLYDSGQAVTLEDIKPYLRSMSSMTDVERGEYEQLCNNCQEQDLVDYNISHLDRTQLIFVID